MNNDPTDHAIFPEYLQGYVSPPIRVRDEAPCTLPAGELAQSDANAFGLSVGETFAGIAIVATLAYFLTRH